ncbi:hypothetical protein BJ742DRAFT_801127 [Cladochytrium replicatum]|nr:hypothetical protein BJ742DRAFT_801127 [Cladochytrium replicatum]
MEYQNDTYQDHGTDPLSESASITASPAQAQASASSSAPQIPIASQLINIVVGEPQKHGEGASAYVSYQVSTKTILESFRNPEMSVRRRFQDFDWLHQQLTEELPDAILPPLPDKHRMEYITGDRFSNEFIERRRMLLELYLQRLTRHPKLMRSVALRTFLESTDLRPTKEETKREAHVFENLSDTLLNAFSKVRKQDERFIKFRESVTTLEDNLMAVDRLHARAMRQYAELEMEMNEFAQCMKTLASMETQVTNQLTDFGSVIRHLSAMIREKARQEEATYVANIREYISYCSSVKDVLRLRDQKQVDHEELTQYLSTHVADRERTLNPARYGRGIAGFLKEKVQEIQGIDSEIARKVKLTRLETRIGELQEAVQTSETVAQAFSEEVVKELSFFAHLKAADLRSMMMDLAETERVFHEKAARYWDELIPILESIRMDDEIEQSDY